MRPVSAAPGADQPRCGHDEHDHQGNGRFLLSPYHGGSWSPWEPCPEPAAPKADEPRCTCTTNRDRTDARYDPCPIHDEPAAPPPAPTEDVAAPPTLTGSTLLAVQGDASRAENARLAADLAAVRAAQRYVEAARDAAEARADLAESRLDGQAWEDLTRDREDYQQRLAATAESWRLLSIERDALRAQVAAVRALHKRTETWCETRIDADTGDQEDRALYDDAGALVAAMDGVNVVCSECAPRMGQPWPCPTIAALDTAPEGRERPATLLPGGDT